MRVSTDKDRQELGVQAQRAAIGSWACRSGVEIVAWYSEEVTGGASLDKRPILLEAIASVGAFGAGFLVFQKWDRFARDPFTAALAEIEVQRMGGRLVSADGMGNGDDPASQLQRDLVLAVAKFEKALIRARTKAALAVKKSRGESTGTAPYGFRVGEGGRLVEDVLEQRVRREVRALRATGLSFRQIRAEATSRGLLGRTGCAFTLPMIFRMTKDVVITGIAG